MINKTKLKQIGQRLIDLAEGDFNDRFIKDDVAFLGYELGHIEMEEQNKQ